MDSLYVWDMTYDCEQEDAIRFRDPVTDKVGFLGKNGNLAIRANYNDARPFYNGLALVVHDGKRVCADGTPYKAGCEHWSWDGKTALINRQGEIVADNINLMVTDHLNWYSCKIADSPADTTLHTSFKTKNNKYYTFINYQKEFKKWFYQQFITGLQAGKLSSYCFDELIVEGLWKQTIRKPYNKVAFTKQYSAVLQKKMGAVNQRKVEVFTVSEALNPYIYDSKNFKVFYTDCGDANEAKFPSFDVITSHYTTSHQLNYQEHFSFLKTANGYKLIGVALKSTK
ncbi:WG repeat-containing protein [Mucilaginibacter terrae]|uniref:WG repeat-containing protein n=1 Tax=Mucilaginibacter terrae TaxID=1955052 RepID=UPI00363BD44C